MVLIQSLKTFVKDYPDSIEHHHLIRTKGRMTELPVLRPPIAGETSCGLPKSYKAFSLPDNC